MKDDNEILKKINQISYSIRLSNDLHTKLDKHLKVIEYQEFNSISKQKWIIDAIKERLEIEENMPPEELPKGRYVNIRIDERLYKKIDEQIEKLKIAKTPYSKKQWILEAMHAKLSREAEKYEDPIAK